MYTAIIVEPRKHAALSYVLNNILTNLSDDWNIVICHGTQNLKYIQNILTSELQKFLNRVTLVNLGVENLTIPEYNHMYCTKEFHKHIPTEIFLKFETDSMILPQNAHLISEFLEYDYVGAPWKDHDDIGNGGFSLRKKTKMLEIIENAKLYNYGEADDAFFSQAKGRVLNNPSIHIYKPTFEKAKQFSVETEFYEQPFGCHAVWKYHPEFVKLHPEVQKLESLQFSI